MKQIITCSGWQCLYSSWTLFPCLVEQRRGCSSFDTAHRDHQQSRWAPCIGQTPSDRASCFARPCKKRVAWPTSECGSASATDAYAGRHEVESNRPNWVDRIAPRQPCSIETFPDYGCSRSHFAEGWHLCLRVPENWLGCTIGRPSQVNLSEEASSVRNWFIWNCE